MGSQKASAQLAEDATGMKNKRYTWNVCTTKLLASTMRT